MPPDEAAKYCEDNMVQRREYSHGGYRGGQRGRGRRQPYNDDDDHSASGGRGQRGRHNVDGSRGRGRGREVSVPVQSPISSPRPVSSGGHAHGGRSWADMLKKSPQSAVSAPHPVPESERHQVSRPVPSCQNEEMEGRLLPVPRPADKGHLSATSSRLRVNHFPVDFSRDCEIMHYNVVVERYPKADPGTDQPHSIPNSILSKVRRAFFAKYPLPDGTTAYDGGNIVYSLETLKLRPFHVTIPAGNEGKQDSYSVSLEYVHTLEYGKLRKFLSNKEGPMSAPEDVLQAMHLVFKKSQTSLSVGRGFYNLKAPSEENDLRRGLIALEGFRQCLKPTSRGLSLCLDFSVLPFAKPIKVFDFLREHISGYCGPQDFQFQHRRKLIEDKLIGLKVMVIHDSPRKKYTIVGLSEKNTKDITFPRKRSNNSQLTSITDYFLDKYKVEIKCQDIPCLDFGNDVFVPIELCKLIEGQRYPNKKMDTVASENLKKKSVIHPAKRHGKIRELVQTSYGRGDGIVKNFGMQVNTTMTSVSGRIIPPPDLKARDQKGEKKTLDMKNHRWGLRGSYVMEGKLVKCWGLIDFTSEEEKKEFKLDCKAFIDDLTGKFRRLGIGMNEPLFIRPSSTDVLASHDLLESLLGEVKEIKDKDHQVAQFILCVMPRRHDGYKTLKWISETKVGVVTQCCLVKTVNDGKDQNLTNLALKINAKLGGSNVELEKGLSHYFACDREHVMVVGADVNHPGAGDSSSASISAVVGTMNWPAANYYAARVSHQRHRVERILNFGRVCLDLADCYKRFNGRRPDKIIIFRDGVSSGQFDMVLNEELRDLKTVFKKVGYNPSITLIVAQKRHLTRFFVEGGSRTAVQNVHPGTVVDSVVVHPFEFDFYLCSHHGNLGTSKPTHYHVLWDEHHFTSAEIQSLIYDMCYTFVRCTSPISLVPPVYYADLVASRGRHYYDSKVKFEGPPPGQQDAHVFELHEQLKDVMFFV